MKKEYTKNYTRGGVPLHELSPNLNLAGQEVKNPLASKLASAF